VPITSILIRAENFLSNPKISSLFRGITGYPCTLARCTRVMAVILSLLLGALLALGSAQVQFRTILDLDTTSQPVALQDGGDYWIDTSEQFTAEQVAGTVDISWAPPCTCQSCWCCRCCAACNGAKTFGTFRAWTGSTPPLA
jgi:hypothetical protein